MNEQLHASMPEKRGLQVCLHANNQLTVGKKTHMFRLIVLQLRKRKVENLLESNFNYKIK